MVNDKLTEFQEQTRELLRAQQAAFLEAMKAWQESVAAGTETPNWPEPPTLENVPTAPEMAEMFATYTAKLLADQSEFMEELGKTIAKK